MSILIERAGPGDLAGIRAFNQRLQENDAGFQFSDSPEALIRSAIDGAAVWQELYLAKDGGTVRGGYLLKHEPLWVGEERSDLWNYQLPLSEGIVSRAYAMVGIQLLQDAMKRSEFLYCLGMGSLERPLPRLLKRSKWSVDSVPFFFRVIHPSAFLKHISYLRNGRTAIVLASIARFSGLGALAVYAWRVAARLRQAPLPQHLRLEEVSSFGPEVDAIFSSTRRSYGALVARTADVLNVRYPESDPRLIRLLVHDGGNPIGWLVLTRTRLEGHKQFGSMRLGCIVDGLCHPDLVPILVRIGTERLIAEQVDLIVSNQTHACWTAALQRHGYASGPSNFIFARSPALEGSTPELNDWHINRGDGDGPINL